MSRWVLLGVTATVFIANLYQILWMTPLEATQGIVQKIFYFHVPSAFNSYAFLILGMFLSIFYLFTKNRSYDQAARASIYTSTIFASLVIGSGPLWARPIWGVYWTWDPRLTLTFVLFVLLLGYCFVQFILGHRESQKERAALIGSLLAVLAVPFMVLTHFSVKIWRGLHPSVLREEGGLAPEFQKTFEFSVFSMFLLGSLIFVFLFDHLRLKDRLQGLIEKQKETA